MLKKTFIPFHYPFKNLVFQGGGVRSYVYHGALRVFEEQGILEQIERVAGASAGALLSTLLSFRLSVGETIDLFKTVDYSQMRSEQIYEELEGKQARLIDVQLHKLRDNVDNLNRLVSKFGLHSNHYAHDWIEGAIAKQCDGNRRATFTEFRQRGFRDLYITAVNISRHRVEVFSADETPQVAVADAVIMSGTLPFFYEALQFDGHSLGKGDYYVDGGILSNFPLYVFDNHKFEKTSHHFTYGVNWETLGCRHYTPLDCPGRPTKINNLLWYAESVFETMSEVQNVAVDQRGVDQYRSINISNCCVSTIDFDLKPEETNPKYMEMIRSGEKATREYLQNYRLPTDRFADVKEKLAEFLEMWG